MGEVLPSAGHTGMAAMAANCCMHMGVGQLMGSTPEGCLMRVNASVTPASPPNHPRTPALSYLGE